MRKNNFICAALNIKVLLAKKGILLLGIFILIINLLFDIFGFLLIPEAIGGIMFTYIIIFKASTLSLLFGVQLIFLFNYFFKKQKQEGVLDIEIRNVWAHKEQFLMRIFIIAFYTLFIFAINVIISFLFTIITVFNYSVSWNFASAQMLGSQLFVLVFVIIFFGIINLVVNFLSETTAIIIGTLLVVSFLLTPFVEAGTQSLKSRKIYTDEIEVNARIGVTQNISNTLNKAYLQNDETKNFISDYQEFITIAKSISTDKGSEFMKLENGTFKDVVEELPESNSLKIVFQDIETTLLKQEKEHKEVSLPFVLSRDHSSMTSLKSRTQDNVKYVISKSSHQVTKTYLEPIVPFLNHFEFLTTKKNSKPSNSYALITRGNSQFNDSKFQNDTNLMYGDHFQIPSVNLALLEMLTIAINNNSVFSAFTEFEDGTVNKSLWDYFYFYDNLMYGSNMTSQTFYESNLFGVPNSPKTEWKIKDEKLKNEYLEWSESQEDYFDKKYQSFKDGQTIFNAIEISHKNLSYIFLIQFLIVSAFGVGINCSTYWIFKRKLIQ
ncbi:hypothetical protein [Spiroplasma alleghenense]|uniref:Uncharacterized protein n=1 Tax=Spiroplasma alleghenense TaxID=216931 RepID=A0A345Z4N5_9MOLU|nr:hypothetical protein [Spiroplasma alleghenense]AXK51564.1 hypothetical protein SALLE_v1c08940 [Spiroplasma alleghenense]